MSGDEFYGDDVTSGLAPDEGQAYGIRYEGPRPPEGMKRYSIRWESDDSEIDTLYAYNQEDALAQFKEQFYALSDDDERERYEHGGGADDRSEDALNNAYEENGAGLQELEKPEFPTYVGWDNKEHGEY